MSVLGLEGPPQPHIQGGSDASPRTTQAILGVLLTGSGVCVGAVFDAREAPGLGAAIVGIAVSVSAILISGRQPTWYAPVHLLASGWLVVGGVHPLLRHFLDGYQTGALGLEVSSGIYKASVFAGVGVLAFSLGYRLAGPPVFAATRGRRLPPLRYTTGVLSLLEAALVLLFFATTLAFLQRVGLSTLIDWRSPQSRALLAETSSYLFFTGYLLVVPALARLLNAADLRDRQAVHGWILFLLSQSMPLVTGSRVALIPGFVSLFVVISLRTRERRIRRAFIVALVLVSLVVGIRVTRQATDTQLISEGKNGLQYIVRDALVSQDTAMLDNFTLLVLNVDSLPERVPGASYAAALLSPIPRELWAGKPLVLDDQLNRALLPAASQQGFGFSFSFFGEAYYNFGMIGLIIVPTITGFGFGRIYRRILRPDQRAAAGLLASIVLLPCIVVLLRGSFSADLPRLVVASAPALLYLAPHRSPLVRHRHERPKERNHSAIDAYRLERTESA